MKNILITGVSTGIGYGAARKFISEGYRVLGSVRKQLDAERLKSELGANFVPLVFDVTRHNEIADAAVKAGEIIGNEGLCGLINNAGATDGCPLVSLSADELRRNFEVLVIGQLMVIQQFLPLLGGTKHSPFKPGRIVNITSVNGRVAVPFLGPYVTAKHAFEGLSDVLRIELQLYGIDVIVVAPGMIKTAIWGKVPDDLAEQFRNTDFYEAGKNFKAYIDASVPKNAMELDAFSNRLFAIFEKKKPCTHYVISKHKFMEYTLPRLLPKRILNRIMAKIMGMNRF